MIKGKNTYLDDYKRGINGPTDDVIYNSVGLMIRDSTSNKRLPTDYNSLIPPRMPIDDLARLLCRV